MRSRAKDGMDMEATNKVRSIHRLGLCSLVCDMLKLVGMGRSRGLLALRLHGTALDNVSREPLGAKR